MNKQQSLAFTFYGLLAVAVMVVSFTIVIKVIDHNEEIKQCQNQSGYYGLEAKAMCRR